MFYYIHGFSLKAFSHGNHRHDKKSLSSCSVLAHLLLNPSLDQILFGQNLDLRAIC